MKNKGLKNMMRFATAGHEAEVHKAALISRQQTIDKMVMAFHYMGMKPEVIRDFYTQFLKAEQDFCEEVLTDAKDDKDIWVAREHIDSVLREALPKDMFVPYDQRYNY